MAHLSSLLTETEEKIFIDRIPSLEWGMKKDTSFIRWCPGVGDVTTGFDVSRPLFRLLGYERTLYSINDQSLDDTKILRRKIIAQINRGIPVIAINLKVCPEWGIITGYLKNRPGILCRTFFDYGKGYSLAEQAPWLSFFIRKKGEASERSVMFRDALTTAVYLAETDRFEQYRSGFSALEQWIEELKRHSDQLEKGAFAAHEVNLTLVINLLDSRRAALEYLTEMSKVQAMKNGNIIIYNYRKELSLLNELVRNVLPSFDFGREEWTSGKILMQVDTLTRILEIEKESIGLIREELKTFVY
jgi:hypothetical protein